MRQLWRKGWMYNRVRTILRAPWAGSSSEVARADLTLGENCPQPVVNHGFARSRALARMMGEPKSDGVPREK
jgi:deoxyribodipyrimidine photolyase